MTERDSGSARANETTMMDTSPGGETPQYESYKGLGEEHQKSSGMLGGQYLPILSLAPVPRRAIFANMCVSVVTGSMPNTTTETSGVDADRAQQTTENIRYGQNISESGMGGMTNSGGFGGTKADSELEGDKNPRSAQQYSVNDGDRTHDHNIGA